MKLCELDDPEQEHKPAQKYWVLIEAATDREQRELLDKLLEDGYQCRALTSVARQA